ncbi:YciI-like protein [Pseudomonas sp. M47T1]|uniref:YciI family protein n=1 Tax=Pseudomonas sp. M47T1 TaxID=1179778 RepID=UPI0002608084|nr:YciI family protein [Pseudomonas sp. M47T1]EIK93739.1 YciI-like protein [Pseudomonas sp. M47T1]
MPFAIYTRDRPGAQAVRAEHRAAHYAYLQAHCAHLIASGGLQDEGGEVMIGGLIIIDFDTRAEVDRFVAGDPFTQAGLFEQLEVVPWKMAFFDGARVAS